jgi:hypothetical protein
MIRDTYDFAILVDSWIDHMLQKKFTLHFKLPVGSFEDRELVGIRIVLSYSSFLMILIKQDM